MHRAERACLTYAFDAYCAWRCGVGFGCGFGFGFGFGFGPILRTFAEDIAHRIRLSVVSAGLYTGARALPVAAYPHQLAERRTITRLTGVACGMGYDRAVSRGTTVLDSTDAAAGLPALREQPGISELDAAEVMQRAWFVDDRSLSVRRTGLPGCSRRARPERGRRDRGIHVPGRPGAGPPHFRTLRRLRVLRYPTLLLDTAHPADQMGGAAPTAASPASALDQRLTTSTPQVPAQ
ncbi:DsbA family protein [Streptomyces dioscori]|uniref:DsbA family protein n=1 Tax=Streptomyces dioscori TaxID=2109333 RepID=UPI001CED50D5|nr:DsbA family protein [Streptomyces dioscori]